MDDEQPALFGMARVPKPESKSPGQRLTEIQSMRIRTGIHPLSGKVAGCYLTLHPEAAAPEPSAEGRRCGNCRFRRPSNRGTSRDYPKCHFQTPAYARNAPRAFPRVTSGAASAVRGWWPACVDHQYPEEGPQ
jgi:hypothetical protein